MNIKIKNIDKLPGNLINDVKCGLRMLLKDKDIDEIDSKECQLEFAQHQAIYFFRYHKEGNVFEVLDKKFEGPLYKEEYFEHFLASAHNK